MLARLREIPGLLLAEQAPLSRYTRFGIGGPARILADASTEDALIAAMRALRAGGERFAVIGGGSNLVASDEGFPGVVIRYTDSRIQIEGTQATVAAGAVLQDLVDLTIQSGLRGLDTMTGIPGWVGGAIYGNAGAYGHSIHERLQSVRFLDCAHLDNAPVREIIGVECEFAYRESIFKKKKDWIILSCVLRLDRAVPAQLFAAAQKIREIRDAKYPPTMRCAGSIFKNLLLEQLPESVRTVVPANVVREGKVPSAFFLEQAGAKGLVRGGVRVADYHANLIYNEGTGTYAQVRELIAELKNRVYEQFGLELEEEVQYL